MTLPPPAPSTPSTVHPQHHVEKALYRETVQSSACECKQNQKRGGGVYACLQPGWPFSEWTLDQQKPVNAKSNFKSGTNAHKVLLGPNQRVSQQSRDVHGSTMAIFGKSYGGRQKVCARGFPHPLPRFPWGAHDSGFQRWTRVTSSHHHGIPKPYPTGVKPDFLCRLQVAGERCSCGAIPPPIIRLSCAARAVGNRRGCESDTHFR
jgi:hypothetical protein